MRRSHLITCYQHMQHLSRPCLGLKAYWVLYFSVTWSDWPTTEEKSKSSTNTSSPLTLSLSRSISWAWRDWRSPEVCEVPSRAHLADEGPQGRGVGGGLSPAEQTSSFQLWFLLGRGQLMRTLSDQCLQPDTSLAASKTDLTFFHLLSKWKTRSFMQHGHRRKEAVDIVLYLQEELFRDE